MRTAEKLEPLDENEIVKQHDGLIRKLSSRFLISTEDREDIAQVGRLALLKALRTWDPSRAKLWTYARQGVTGAMIEHATRRLEIWKNELTDFVPSENGRYQDEAGRVDGAAFADPPNQESAVEVSDLLQGLDVEEKSVIRLSLTGLGLVEVGYCLEISKSEVWRIYQRAVSKMQRTISEGT